MVIRRSIPITAVVLAVFVAAPGAANAQARLWRADTRIVVTDGGFVLGVAAGPREVFVLTPGGIAVRDFGGRRWNLPLPLPRMLAGARPTAIALDPVGALWLGTESGDVFSLTPGIDEWDRISGAATGPIEALVPVARDGALYVGSRGQWRRVAFGSFFPEPVSPATLPAIVTASARPTPADPYFAAAAATLGLDDRGRNWPLTRVASGPDPGLYWVGTGGGGLIRFDSRSNRKEWLRFGLAGSGTGSIYRSGDTLWFGGDGRDARSGLASTTVDLADWRQFDRSDGAPSGFVAEMVPAFDRLWFASSDGLFSLDRSRPDRPTFERITSANAHPSERVRCLLFAAGWLWAGTDRGAVILDGAGAVVDAIFTGTRVSRMAEVDGGLLVATDAGLRRVAIGEAGFDVARISMASADPALAARVTDVVATADGVFAVANGRLHAVGPVPSTIRDARLDRIGPILRLAWTEGQLWAAGERGIARRSADGGWNVYTVPEDIPAGPVVDVLAVGADVWAATPAGAVRLRWQ